MPGTDGATLVGLIEAELMRLKELCAGIDEKTAGAAPEGRWSPKQILSHLCGPEGVGLMPALMMFFEEEPRIDIVPEDPFYSDNRAKMTLEQLMTEVEMEYSRIAGFASALDEKLLGRKAYVPILKSSPVGDHPTLGEWIEMMAVGHINFHIGHMREILQQTAGS
jgi:hypothetical protein